MVERSWRRGRRPRAKRTKLGGEVASFGVLQAPDRTWERRRRSPTGTESVWGAAHAWDHPLIPVREN
jgi:hypothetical protein